MSCQTNSCNLELFYVDQSDVAPTKKRRNFRTVNEGLMHLQGRLTEDIARLERRNRDLEEQIVRAENRIDKLLEHLSSLK